ncbi:hypothetical protein [Allorhizocola rhizosphaerae]|uniref:hypothetical protein n=1 Tax=Allorhizocola rhizosphaerae TaxID=1872709 RepID=UPI000E3E6010|nr:hypothetical protein [Allorhizocola rhizosphaerae]
MNHRYEASVLNAMGDALHAMGHDEEAFERHGPALAMATETGDDGERRRAAEAIATHSGDSEGPLCRDVK